MCGLGMPTPCSLQLLFQGACSHLEVPWFQDEDRGMEAGAQSPYHIQRSDTPAGINECQHPGIACRRLAQVCCPAGW